MCFGGGDDNSSKKIIKMQKEEAAKAAARETDRQARLTQGLAAIRGMFHGSNELQNVTKNFSTSGLAAGAALPSGYKYIDVPVPAAAPAAAAKTGFNAGNAGSSQSGMGGGRDGNRSNNNKASQPNNRIAGSLGQKLAGGNAAAPAAATTKKAIQGPDGRVYQIGDNLAYGAQEATGPLTGEWQTDFLNDYKKKIIDYFTPQVAEQYGKAATETGHRLNDAGLAESTAGIMAAADLEKQRKIREGEVANKADTDAGNMADQIKREEDAAVNLLYSTENPEVAAGSATRGVQNLTAEGPALSPLESLFEIASIGGANLYKGLSNAKSVGGFNSSSSTGRNQKTIGG